MASFKEYQMLFQLNASTGSGFSSTFQAGSSTITAFQEKINSLNKTQADISSYQKQQSAIDKTKAKIDLYATQLTNLQNAEASTSKEEAELANSIAAKQKQLDDATKKLDEQNAALSETGAALRAAGVDTKDLTAESARLKTEAQEVADAQKEEAEAAQEAGKSLKDAMEGAKAALEAAGIITALKEVYGALMDCSEAAAKFETAMAGVKRTVGGSDSFIADLGETFKSLSTEMPITAEELAGIATTAGQLGIAQDNVESFTKVMAMLATTTDLSADSAATMLAQFANITGVTDYERLGSTVAALGDSTATTASKVVEMSQGMAAAANIAGMSETDILAIAAAVGSLGIEAASGSTSMSQLITRLYKATETGNQLEEIAAVAGMTGEEFKQAWGVDAVSAMDAFIQGLNDTERNGRSAVVILDELGINNVRQTKAILGLASAEGLLSGTIAQANGAWNENTALNQKAGIMYETTEAKMTMMQNAANNVKVAIGDALNPALSSMYESLTALLQPVAEWIEANPAIVQGITAFLTVLGVATAAVVGYTAATKLAAAASAIFSASIPGLGLILGIAGAVGLLTAGLSALGGTTKDTSEQFSELDTEFDNLTDQAKHQQQILDLCEDYEDLSKQAENVKKLISGKIDGTVHFTPEGPSEEEMLTEEDFGISDQTIKYLATLENASYEDVKQKAEDLKGQITSVDQQLNTAKNELQKSISYANTLQEKIEGTKNRKQKSALQKELAEITETIEAQQREVEELQSEHDDLSAEYKIVGQAAVELKEQEDQLTETKMALAQAAGFSTEASEGNAEAFDKEAEAAKRDAEAQLALIRASLYDNLSDQVQLYAQAVSEAETAQENYNDASSKQAIANRLQGKTVEEVNAEYQNMLRTLDEMQTAEGWTPTDVDYTQLAHEAQDFIDLMAGYDVGDVLQDSIDLADGFVTWADSFGHLNMSAKEWTNTLAGMNTEIAETSDEMDRVDKVQTGFIDNLVDAVSLGAITIDEAKARVREALAGEANAETLLTDIMGQVRDGVDAVTEAKEDYADVTEEVTDATEDEHRSVESILDDLKDLQKEYETTYEKAYTSMSGQFKLFEDAKSKLNQSRQGSKGGVKGMKKALEDQTQYIREYGNNFETVSKHMEDAGVSSETANAILSQLSDGSVESAQYLQTLASASTEELKALTDAYDGLKTEKEQYASTVAEIQTDFSDKMTVIQNELVETVKAMDMSSDAADNAKSTLEAYVDAADGYVSLASQKYGAVAKAAVAALKSTFANLFNGGGHARGTRNAQRGMAWVGEEGPELMWFNGGETVMNHNESLNYAQSHFRAEDAIGADPTRGTGSEGGNIKIDYAPVYQFNGGMAAEDVRGVLEEHSATMRDEIESILEEINEDYNRRKLA